MINDFILLLKDYESLANHLVPYSLLLSLITAVKLLLACKAS
jgi:hypothetical protein